MLPTTPQWISESIKRKDQRMIKHHTGDKDKEKLSDNKARVKEIK